MIGSLMYLTASRPDTMFAVCAYARHQVTPKECHLHTVKRIFRYLKAHPKLGLWYPKESPFDLVTYSDSDYGGATQDRKSTTRGCQFLGRRPLMRPMGSNMNAARPNRTSFNKPVHSYTKRPFQRTSAMRSQYRAPWGPSVNRNFPSVNRKFSTVSRNVSTVNRKFPTANRKFPSGSTKFSTADMGKKGKAGSSQNNIDDKCYWDSGFSSHMTDNISYLSDYEPFNGGYVSFGQGGCKITGKGTIKTSTKDAASQEVKKDVSSLRCIALPNWVHDAILESSSSKPQDDCSTAAPESSGNSNPTATSTNPSADQLETLTVETSIPTVSLPVLTACFTNSQEPSNILGVTTNSDESNGVEADVSNMETTITASPTPTLRIHKDHPKRQIIGSVDTPIQTRNKSKENVWTLVDCPKGEEEIDYDEVFAPVARIRAIRLFLAYASFMGFTVYQMDVKNAFLYGTIDEEVYVMQPPGFEDPEFPAKVYKVEKWYNRSDTFYQKARGDFILVQVYVDDIIFGSSNPQLCREFEALMHEKFQMSAMGELNFFLGLQVLQKEDGIFLSQDKYLKGHPKLGLWYPKESPFDLVTYSDSDYGGATQDRKSTTRGCQFLGKRLISWQCKKQTIVATSTTEAEYIATASCCGQVLWIQNQLLDYGNQTSFYQSCFEKKLISVDHIHTDENVADLLTKPFDAGRFQYLVVEHAMRGSV
nr:copia protein [Tanacetum cinerariifolium]